MPIECSEDWSARKYTITATPGMRDWSATRQWLITGASNENDAWKAQPIPGNSKVAVQNESHPQNSYLLATKFSVDQIAPTVFRATATYSTSQGTSEKDPLKQPPRIRWRVGNTNISVDRDAYKKPIVNSAGQAFDQAPQISYGTLHLEITRNEPYYDVQKAIKYQNAVNLDQWTLPNGDYVTVGQAKCDCIECTTDFDKDSKFVSVRYVFELRRDGFKYRLLDAGSASWFKPPSGVAQLGGIYDKSGNRVSTPVRLDAGSVFSVKDFLPGDKNSTSSFTINPTKLPDTTEYEVLDDARFLKYTLYDQQPFQNLNLI